ncbi:MAG: HPP family protein [bacterium]
MTLALVRDARTSRSGATPPTVPSQEDNMTQVRDIMQPDVITIPPNASVQDLVRLLDRHRVTGMPVVDEQEILVGVVSMRDVLRLAREMRDVPEAVRWGLGTSLEREEAALPGTPPLEGEFFAYYITAEGAYVDVTDQIRSFPEDLFEGYRVEDIMTSAPHTVSPDAEVKELAERLLECGVHRALVADSGQLRGIVTTTDLVRVVAEN